MQTTYATAMTKGLPGMKADMGDDRTLTYYAEEAIYFGRGVTQGAEGNAARLPNRNVGYIDFSGDLVTSNTINLKVNGVAMSQVTFASNHNTTMAAIATAIEAIANTNYVATVSAARQIKVVNPDGDVLFADIVVAAGSSQATGTASYTSSEVFLGIARLDASKEQNTSGVASYAAEDAVSVASKGAFYVYTEETVVPGDPVYMRTYAGSATELVGQFRKTVDSGDAVLVSNARWIEGGSADGVAVLEINLP